MSDDARVQSSSPRCACGETIWVRGEGWALNHGEGSCLVQNKWIERYWFEKPPRALIEAYLSECAMHSETSRRRSDMEEHRDRLHDELQRMQQDAAEWQAVAAAQARIIGRNTP